MTGPDDDGASRYENMDARIAAWEKLEKQRLVDGLKPISPKLASWALARFAEGFTADAVRKALAVTNKIAAAGR